MHAGILAAALLAAEPQAVADAPRFELAWTAPAGCPTSAQARGRVERFLGRPIGRPGDPDVDVHVAIVDRDGLFVAAITTGDGGERQLEGERCDVVADAAAYVVAALIDPTVEPPQAEDPPAEPAPTPPVAKPQPRPPTKPPPAAKESELRGALRLGAAVGVGALPSVAPGVSGAAALLWRRLRIEIGATHWFARPARVAGRPGVGGDIQLTTGSVRICGLAVRRPIELPICGGFELGGMQGRGVGIDRPARARLLWAAFSASAGIIWMPSRWVGMWADAALVVPVSRPIFEAENVGRIHQPAPAAFAGMLGIETRFP